MRNPFSKASRDARMAKMQERADRIIAEQNAKGIAAQEEYARWQAGQDGGGASVGGRQATAPPSFDPNQPLPPIRDLLKQSLEYAKDSAGEMFDDRRDVLDPGGADLNKPPPELEDPAQLEEVTERLKGFDPARVYGIHRVPDRYDLKRNNENKARVEWEIAHAPGAAVTSSEEVHLAAFNRADHWAVPRGRRRPQRGLLRRPGHPRRHQERPRRSLAGELPQQRARRPRAHPRRRARRDRLPRP